CRVDIGSFHGIGSGHFRRRTSGGQGAWSEQAAWLGEGSHPGHATRRTAGKGTGKGSGRTWRQGQEDRAEQSVYRGLAGQCFREGGGGKAGASSGFQVR